MTHLRYQRVASKGPRTMGSEWTDKRDKTGFGSVARGGFFFFFVWSSFPAVLHSVGSGVVWITDCPPYVLYHTISWWRHQMETFSVLLALCAGNSPVTGEFLAQRPVTRSFDVFFDLQLNKRLSKQSWGWWFETHRAHYDVIATIACLPSTMLDWVVKSLGWSTLNSLFTHGDIGPAGTRSATQRAPVGCAHVCPPKLEIMSRRPARNVQRYTWW